MLYDNVLIPNLRQPAKRLHRHRANVAPRVSMATEPTQTLLVDRKIQCLESPPFVGMAGAIDAGACRGFGSAFQVQAALAAPVIFCLPFFPKTAFITTVIQAEASGGTGQEHVLGRPDSHA